jgi:hypothetical protein
MAKFTAWCPETGDFEDGKVFDAYSAEEAAEKWAAREDSWGAEYLIVGGRSEPIVHVRSEGGAEQRFKVRGEAVPAYYARPLAAAEAPNAEGKKDAE